MTTSLRYYTVVQGSDGKGQAGAVAVGVTLGGLIAVHTKGGMQVLLDGQATAGLVGELQGAVRRVAAHHSVGEGDAR